MMGVQDKFRSTFIKDLHNIVAKNNKNYIRSDNPATVIDLEKNKIYLDNMYVWNLKNSII